MPTRPGTSSKLVSTAIFILLEFASLAMLHSSSTVQNIWLNRASHRISACLWGFGTRVGSYFQLSSRNKMLEEENAALSEELRRYRSIERQQEYLSSFESYSDGFDYIFSRIVKMGSNAQRNYIVIDKGSRDGITTDCGIVTAEGVVGVIDAVDKDLSYGRTLMNPNMSVSVRIGHNGVAGPLSWTGKGMQDASLDGIPIGSKAVVGDTVWTSGYSALFPPDIPVGVVQGITTKSGASQDIQVRLLQKFNALDYVTVVKYRKAEQIRDLEKQEQ